MCIFRSWPDINPFSAAVSSGQDYVEGDCLADQWGLSVKTGSTNEEPPASQPSPSEPTILSPQLHRLLLTWAGTYNEWLKLRPDFIVWIKCPLLTVNPFQKSYILSVEVVCFQGGSLVCLLAGKRAILDETFTRGVNQPRLLSRIRDTEPLVLGT